MYEAILLMALGAWGPNGCPPVGGPRLAPVPFARDHVTTYEWRGFADDPDQVALMRWDGFALAQVGGWRFSTGTYRPYDRASGWGAACQPPTPPPLLAQAAPKKVAAPARGARPCAGDCDCRCSREGACVCFLTKTRCELDCPCFAAEEKAEAGAGAERNFGVLPDAKGDGPTEYRLNGTDCTRERAWKALAEGSVPDDGHKLRLTIIGDEEQRKRVLADLELPPMADWRDKLLVQAYPPDHWAVKDAGFVCSGQPTIYVQTPAGKVLHRQDDYGGAGLDLYAAIRRANDKYQPAKDPDLRKETPVIPPAVNPFVWPWPVWAGLAAALAFVGGLLAPRPKPARN